MPLSIIFPKQRQIAESERPHVGVPTREMIYWMNAVESMLSVVAYAGPNIQPVGSANFSGTNTTRFAVDGHVHEGIFSLGVSNLGNTIGNTGVFPGQFVFQGGNNITLSQITAPNGLYTVLFSGQSAPPIATTVQSVGSANSVGTVTRFAPEDHQHEGLYAGGVSTGGNTAGNTTVQPGRVVFEGGNNITLSVNTAAGRLQTIVISGAAAVAQTNQTLGIYHVGNTTGESSSSTYDARTVSWNGAGIVSVGWSAGSLMISATAGGGTLSAFAVSNTTQSTSGTLNPASIIFAGAGIASVGVSNGSVLISVPAGGGAAGTNTFGISNLGNTSGTSGVISGSAVQFILAGGNNITLSQSINGSSATVTISAFNQTEQTQSRFNLTVGGNSTSAGAGFILISSGVMTLAGGNNVTLSQNGNAITISAANETQTVPPIATTVQSVATANSVGTVTRFAPEDHRHEGVYAGGVSNIGNTAGNTTVQPGRIVFAGGNNITLSVGTAANALQTITISAPNQSNQQMTLFATSNTTQSSSGTTNASSLIFAGAGGVSVGITNGSILISGGAGGAGVLIGISTQGNTAGTTGLVSGQYLIVGTSNITLSQSVNGQSATLSLIAPAGGGGGGITMSWYPPFPIQVSTSSNNVGTSAATGGSTQWTGSFHVAPLVLQQALSFSRIDIEQFFATIAGTGSQSHLLQVGIYTLNGGTALSLLSSFMHRHEISQNSVTARTHRWYWGTNSTSNSSSLSGNVSTLFTGLRNIPMYVATSGSLSAGNYWAVFNQINRSSSVAVMPAASIAYQVVSFSTAAIELGSTNMLPGWPLLGQFSSTTNTNVLTAQFMPASIHTSVITRTGGTSQWKWPHVKFVASS